MVYHIMADGTMRDSIAGVVVEDPAVYDIIDRVNQRLKQKYIKMENYNEQEEQNHGRRLQVSPCPV